MANKPKVTEVVTDTEEQLTELLESLDRLGLDHSTHNYSQDTGEPARPPANGHAREATGGKSAHIGRPRGTGGKATGGRLGRAIKRLWTTKGPQPRSELYRLAGRLRNPNTGKPMSAGNLDAVLERIGARFDNRTKLWGPGA
jgi:hypothetical protein